MYLQVFLGIVGFILNVSLFVTSKLSLLFLLHQYWHQSRETWTASLAIVLAFPELCSLVQLIWCTSFLVKDRFRSWPPIPGLFSGILCAFLEAVSLAFFTLRVGPKLHPLVFIPLLSGVLSVKIFIQNFTQESRFFNNRFLDNFTRKYVKHLRFAISGIVCASIIISISCVAGFYDVLKLPEVLILSSSILALSFTWCPGVQYFTIRSRDGTVSGRDNSSILYTLIRIITIFFVAICVLWLEHRPDLTDAFNAFIQAFETIQEFPNLKYAIVIHILSGLLFHFFTYLSTRIRMTWTGIYLPTVLATPIVLAFVAYDDITQLCMVTNGVIRNFTVALWICVFLACLLWLLPFITLGSKYTQCPDTLLKPLEANFFRFSYCNIFLEYQLHLNYKPLGFMVNEPDTDLFIKNKTISKIFICTTMYREADYEMERLLKSLQRISLSDKIRHVYLESHIIMDNGAQGKTLSEFTLQLLWLLQTKLDVARTDVFAHQMPYGLQLQWILKGGMPLFLHLKDNEKVKPKKRWSQIMYMNYIVDIRIKRSYEWLEKQHERFDLMGAINARYEIPEIKFNGLDSLNCSMDTETQSLRYSDTMSTREHTPRNYLDSDIGVYASDDMSSAWSEESDAETEESYDPTQLSYKNQTYLTVPKMNGKFHHSAINRGFVLESYAKSPRLNGVVNGGVPPPTQKLVTTISGDVIKDEDIKSPSLSQHTSKIDNQTYILATDADMKFDADSILELLTVCNSDMRLGGACGRTHPVGNKNNPIVWFQMFEYAKDFWMIKSAQNIIGSVMCCPGCFSLYRVNAIKELLQTYSQPSVEPYDVFIKDTGEDRWMCTLMMLQGWKMKFCTFGFNTTYCPSNLDEFLKQRRRWMLSDVANTFLVMRRIIGLIRHNACFSIAYVLYLMQLFLITVISPGSTVIMITAGLNMIFDLNFIGLTISLSVIILFYTVVCIYAHSKFQTYITLMLTWLLGAAITCIFVGGAIFVTADIITDMELRTLQFQEHYILILLTSSVFYASILHPHETWIIFLGLFYVFMFPAMHILLPVYSTCNIIDQSWGTRDGSKAVVPKFVCFPKIRRRKRKKKTKKNSVSPFNDYTLPLSNTADDEIEYKFWKYLRETVVGKSSKVGLDKESMAKRLWKLRTKSIIALYGCNITWIIILAYFFSVISENTSKLNSFAMISGFLYGISFAIQLIGMTVHRAQDSFERLVRYTNKNSIPEWIISKSKNTWRGHEK